MEVNNLPKWTPNLRAPEKYGLFQLRKPHKCSYHSNRNAICEMHGPSDFLYYCAQCAGIKPK